MKGLGNAFTTDFLISFALVVIILLLFALIANLYSELSTVKMRYKRMMEGAEGESIEQMLSSRMSDINRAVNESRKIQNRLDVLDELVKSSLARVAVIHFDAFENTGQGLSWCVALLDRNYNGVIFSSICGQNNERSYVKPIEEGRVSSKYKLTREEEQALRQAMNR
jgi:ABC-type Na+ efflux pump permease subunit